MTDTPGKNGYAHNRDVSSILEDWIFLVPEESGVLARCTDIGLNVELWHKLDFKLSIKGKKIILVFQHQGQYRAEEFQILEKVRAAEPAQLRVWQPMFLGDDKYPTLKELGKQFSLAEMLWWDKPWDYQPPATQAERRMGWPCTDLGNAERMASRYGSVMRYCKPWKKWMFWNGQRWGSDDLGKVNAMAKTTVRKILEEAAGAYDQEERIMLAKWAIKCEEAKRIESMLKLVWSEPRIPVLPSVFDSNPWLFNCPNGTINLRTGQLQSPDRDDMITRMSPVEFDPDAECPLWEATIDRIFNNDDDLIGFIQRLFGLCLTGDVSEQVLPIFYGEGGNGKSTILNALLDIMGPDYAIAAPPGLLFSQKQPGHPTDKASLFGMRLVVDLESAEGAKLNEALVKQLTGSDRISARRMREDFWTFNPTHKLIVGTNSQPSIQETKNAIWRRLKLVPFLVEIPEQEQQLDLPIRLRSEFPGILAWCVRGCLRWVLGGLQTPQVIQAATAEYRAEEDSLGSFIEEECLVGGNYKVKATPLYKKLRKYFEGSGTIPMTQQSFGRTMTKRGFAKYTNNGTFYLGIALRSEETTKTDDKY